MKLTYLLVIICDKITNIFPIINRFRVNFITAMSYGRRGYRGDADVLLLAASSPVMGGL